MRGRKTVQLLRWDWKRVHRVDDRLAFPTRQGLRNLAMFPERNRQDDCVCLECIPQRLGDDRGSNRSSLRRQLLRRPAARDGHLHVSTGEGAGEGLAYLAESYNRIAHSVSPIRFDVGVPLFNVFATYESFRVVSASMGKGPGLTARASASVSIYSL